MDRGQRAGTVAGVMVTCAVALAVCVLGGCTIPRRDAPPALTGLATPIGFPATVRLLSTDRTTFEARAAGQLRRLRESSRDGVVHVLTLSGGGAGGAFGAGALIGLSRRQERPQFEVVTGVSAGALIAPFAFLGPTWDSELTDAFTSGRGEGMSIHGIFQLLFSSGHRSASLTSLVDRYITTDLIDAVAREAATGRLLLVATTDLDREEPVIWDMGAIAARGGEPARRLFRDVLVASASIPGVFAPVLIHVQDGSYEYDELHVDGNASTAVFVAPAAAYFSLLDPPTLDGAKVYVLINGQLAGTRQDTSLSMGSIVYHTFSTAMKQMSRAQIVAVNQFAEKYRMSVRSTYLPVDYPPYNSADFRASTMRTLFDYGARCAEQGRLWTSVADAIAGIAVPATREAAGGNTGLQCPSRDTRATFGVSPDVHMSRDNDWRPPT